MNVFDWAHQNRGERQPLATLIDALRATEVGTPIWCTWGGAVDETTMVGQAIHRWFGNDPMQSIAYVTPIAHHLPRVPRMFTRPLCMHVIRGEQASWIVVQGDQ